MKILYVHNDYALPSGEEHAAEMIAELLRSRGHHVEWFRRSSAPLVGSTAGKLKAFFCGIHNPASAAELDASLRRHRPDLVQVQNVYPLISPSIFPILKRWGVPVVMRCPNYRLFCPNGRHLVKGQVCEQCLRPGRELWCILRNCEDSFSKSTAYAIRHAAARIRGGMRTDVHVFLVQSQFQRNLFIRNGIDPNRIEVLPGMVRTPDLPEPIPSGESVTFAGRLSAEKGIREFLEAARLLSDIPFVVAGDDSHMRGIRDRSPANLTWRSFLRGKELQDLYLQSRVVVVPSRWYEGFPNVLLEAMSLGRPTVCSAIGALPEIVEAGVSGLLCRPGDAAHLAQQIRTLYQDAALCRRLGQAAHEKTQREYSPGACYQRLMAAYYKAMKLSGRRPGRGITISGAAIRSLPKTRKV